MIKNIISHLLSLSLLLFYYMFTIESASVHWNLNLLLIQTYLLSRNHASYQACMKSSHKILLILGAFIAKGLLSRVFIVKTRHLPARAIQFWRWNCSKVGVRATVVQFETYPIQNRNSLSGCTQESTGIACSIAYMYV